MPKTFPPRLRFPPLVGVFLQIVLIAWEKLACIIQTAVERNQDMKQVELFSYPSVTFQQFSS
jgi:hypothetical protein